MNAPKFGGLMQIAGDGALNDLPDVEHPYYIGAKDGLFLHRRLLFGRGVVKQNTWPSNWHTMGTSTGIFTYDAPVIPGELMAKVTDFFRRIYRKYHAEAAVLLVFNPETKEWGVFIPTQLVSHGGVNYVYDHTHIKRPWYVVGSIHSHCDFSPFHSGTDTGDADEFDGLHMTIGFIEQEEPGIVAMVAMNKVKMHYASKDFPEIFDFTQLWQHEAPEWWDQYVGPHNSKPVGFELYAKFAKPTAIKDEKPKFKTEYANKHWQPTGKSQQGIRALQKWDPEEAAARQAMADWGIPGWQGSESRLGQSASERWMRENGYDYDPNLKTWKWVGHAISRESAEFNARKAAEHGAKWDKDGSLTTHHTEEEYIKLFDMLDSDDYWEDLLRKNVGDKVVDAMFEDDVIREEDIEYAIMNPHKAGTGDFWIETFLSRAIENIAIVRMLGIDAVVDIRTIDKDGKEEQWLLPQDAATPPKGVHL